MDISVVIPVFNGGRKISRAIRALQRQKTDRTYEIIVVDDGSTDGSLQGVQTDNVRVLRQHNQGPAAARNLGVKNAQGRIVLFTDADCEPLDDWIEQMVNPLEQFSVSGIKGSYLTRQKGIVPRFVQLEYESKYNRMKKDRFIDFVDTYAAGFVKNDFLNAGKFDTRFPTASVEDQEFSFRMWQKGYRMIFNPEAKVYHSHAPNLWNYVRKKFWIGYWKALVLKKHPGKALRDSHTPQLLKLEMVFTSLFLLCLALSLVRGEFLACAFIALACFMVAIAPFMVKVFKRDPVVALFSPVLLFVRAISLGLGLGVGVWKLLISKAGAGPAETRTTRRSSV